MTRLAAPVLALLLLAMPGTVSATHSTLTRCEALVARVNAYRPDLRLWHRLCRVAATRSVQMARAGRIWHDLRPVMRMLTEAGVCWRNVGEVIAWNTYAGTARAFVDQWHRSAAHWDLLMARRYDTAGGAWIDYSGRHYATFYVLDRC